VRHVEIGDQSFEAALVGKGMAYRTRQPVGISRLRVTAPDLVTASSLCPSRSTRGGQWRRSHLDVPLRMVLYVAGSRRSRALCRFVERAEDPSPREVVWRA
jgi:hypothetical protein